MIVDKKNAKFTGHKDIWQNSQYKEDTNKANSATVLKSTPTDSAPRQFQQEEIVTTDSWTTDFRNPPIQKRKTANVK